MTPQNVFVQITLYGKVSCQNQPHGSLMGLVRRITAGADRQLGQHLLGISPSLQNPTDSHLTLCYPHPHFLIHREYA
jgi:hypothetical protein